MTSQSERLLQLDEEWQDPLLDISLPYKSTSTKIVGYYTLDDDLKNLISLFSVSENSETYIRIGESSLESNLRILKTALLIQPDIIYLGKNTNGIKQTTKILQGSSTPVSDLEFSRAESDAGELFTYPNATTYHHETPVLSTIKDGNFQEIGTNYGSNHDNGGSLCGSYSVICTSKSMLPNSSYNYTGPSLAFNNINSQQIDLNNAALLMEFFRELEAAKLFDNLGMFSGLLTAHSIHLKIIQEIVEDMLSLEELRLRLCSQLASLLNPIILSRLQSYSESLNCTAFTMPEILKTSNCKNERNDNDDIPTFPNPKIYKWPSTSLNYEEYRMLMKQLPFLCFSEVYDLSTCINVFNQINDLKLLEYPSMTCKETCSTRVIHLNSLYKSTTPDQPMFAVDYFGNDSFNFSHSSVCPDIAQDSKDIERDVLYINGRLYNGATSGYGKILEDVSNLIDLYWTNIQCNSAINEGTGIFNDKLMKKDIENCNGMELPNKQNISSNNIDIGIGTDDTDQPTLKCESIVIAIILLHIISRTYSGGTCFDKVSSVYNNTDCIMISPDSKRARPLEIVILPNIALLFSSLRFRLYEQMEQNMAIGVLPSYLVDTHVVSRLIPSNSLIKNLPTYAFHILSRTPVSKIPPSILEYLIRCGNKFISKATLYKELATSRICNSCIQEQCINNPVGNEEQSIQINRDVNRGSSEINKSAEQLHTDRIIEVTTDDIAIMTPGEAVLFQMLTKSQDKEDDLDTTKFIDRSNLVDSSLVNTLDSKIKRAINTKYSKYGISNPEDGNVVLYTTDNVSADLHYSDNECSEEHKFNLLDAPEKELHSGNCTLDCTGNNYNISPDLLAEGDISNSQIARLYFGKSIEPLEPSSLQLNVYVVSSENSSQLANDLRNLPKDSIGAIDQEIQQQALILQSHRSVSQFGIFSSIVNT
ncbi:hypothetical protein cand_000200 [Cryptosporidium andersoni]|uniref:Uncharacterized protein n=1 Tax=Cryptosporidium andersoni TaxID=117008 RepID=A0A1J4MUB8_9CRYT|nr:hypothetical protein cand_000200 [Cryptosporidium andersoni]